MQPNILANKIKLLVSQHHILRALNLAHLNAPSSDLQDQAIQLLQRWQRLMIEKGKGVISQEAADLNANRIADGLLTLASAISNCESAQEENKEKQQDAVIINTFSLLMPVLLSSVLYFLSSTTYFNAPVELSKEFFSASRQTKSHYLLIRKNPELFSPKRELKTYEAEALIRPGQRDTFQFIQVEIQPIRNSIDVGSSAIDNTESVKIKSFKNDKNGVFKFLIKYRCKSPDACRPLRNNNRDIYTSVKVNTGTGYKKVPKTNAFDYIYIRPFGTLLPFSILLYTLLFFKKRITLELYVLWYRLNTRT